MKARRGLVHARAMRLAAAVGAALLVGCEGAREGGGTPLPTGKVISPVVRASQAIGSLPMNMAMTPDGRYVITSDMGYYEALWSVRTSDGVGVSHVDFLNPAPPRATTRASTRVAATRSAAGGAPGAGSGGGAVATSGGEDSTEATVSGSPRSNGLYYGLAIARDNTVYAAQGGHDSIAVLKLAEDGTLTLRDTIATKHLDFPAGVALDEGGRIYAANNAAGTGPGDNPYKLTASVAIYDTGTKAELGRFTFSDSYGGTSNFPYGIAVLKDGSKAFVASERDDAVYVIDTRNPATPALAAKIGTGAHPIALLLNKDQTRLFVANSLGDTVSVIDTAADKILAENGTIFLRPSMVKDIPGATPTALALGAGGDTLYVTLSDMNAVAVVDIDDAEVKGYIPTGWYPSSVVMTLDEKHLLVTNARGSQARNPNNKPDPRDAKSKTTPILRALEGNVSLIDIPHGAALKESTAKVLADNRLDKLAGPQKNPLAKIDRAAGKITHVIYIIKENRTYDQVLADLPQGNGDTSLVLFGKEVTPNQHALAERFVLLDNLYASGEVSGDGWAWSTQGMADAYVSRNVPYNYSHRGRKFDFEGHNNGYPTAGVPAVGLDGKPLTTRPAFEKGAERIPDVANTNRNIWDAAREAGIPFRNYGFFLTFSDAATGTVGGPDNWPNSPGLQPPGHDLAGVTDIDYRRFDLGFADSDAGNFYFQQTGDEHCLYPEKEYGKNKLPSRFAEWNREFQMMLAKDASGGAVPALMLVRLGDDHTSAASAGKHSPRSMVADNDYAVGEMVEAVSKSAIWKNTAIVIIEDDAQNGVDHVDCHRMPSYVISPYIKPHAVDHRFYNTDSALKTIELLLGMKPLAQYDAVADPILDWADGPVNAEPYTAIMPSKEIIAQLNVRAEALAPDDPRRELALRSDKMDFSHADAQPADELNEIVWKTVKGAESEMPSPKGVMDDDD